MKYLTTLWRARPQSTRSGAYVRPDHRPSLARAMCRWCARRWLSGRAVWHRGCAEDVSYAIDLHFERLRSAADTDH
jgi:hypothetical protein